MKNATKIMWFDGRELTKDQLVALVNSTAWQDNFRKVCDYHRTAFRLDEDVEQVPVRTIITQIPLYDLFFKLSKDYKSVIVAQSKFCVKKEDSKTESDDSDDYDEFTLRWLETFEGDEEYVSFDDVYEDD